MSGRTLHDPLGFVQTCDPWGKNGTALEQFEGPDEWQQEFLHEIGLPCQECRTSCLSGATYSVTVGTPALTRADPEGESGVRATADTRIYAAGGHFVLCAPSKRQIWRGWNRQRPPFEVAELHRSEDGLLGIIPWSLRRSALDVDHGDPRNLFEHYDPWADLPSRRGRHAYYDDDEPRANATWAARGCRGDVRSAKDYLVLHRVPTRFVLKYTRRLAHRELGGVDLDLAVEDDVLPRDRVDITQQVEVEREVRRGPRRAAARP